MHLITGVGFGPLHRPEKRIVLRITNQKVILAVGRWVALDGPLLRRCLCPYPPGNSNDLQALYCLSILHGILAVIGFSRDCAHGCRCFRRVVMSLGKFTSPASPTYLTSLSNNSRPVRDELPFPRKCNGLESISPRFTSRSRLRWRLASQAGVMTATVCAVYNQYC